MLQCAQDTVGQLASYAAQQHVTLKCSGDHAVIAAIPRLIGEIIYNLCDNGIKYNTANGSVDVSVSQTPHEAILQVKDTGIGIPKEHQKRVFERFYRVDKSHSKEIGGTGLGLSIVKHAAMIHSATVEMDSVPAALAVLSKCVPPQSSLEKSPIETTRTVSPYFSPNNATAPDFLASSIDITSVRTL